MLTFLKTNIRPVILLLIAISGCTTTLETSDYVQSYGPSAPKKRVISATALQHKVDQGATSFIDEIKPILDSRCVVCHGCYDAPCQLKLSSIEGLDRGATKQVVYDGDRLNSAPPTRLLVDANTTAMWREKNFFPVLNEREQIATANLENSLLAKMLQLKRLNPLPEKGALDSAFDLDISRSLQCPKIDEFDKYQQQHPLWGMPYALPGLALEQEYKLLKWLQEGALTSPGLALSKPALAAIKRWEVFFNGETKKQQLMSRYIYEHLFIGHLHFQGHPDNQFYRLVRSKTAPGSPIEEIASLRPYEAAKVDKFYYRLRPIVATIVDKTHLLYQLSPQKMARYRQLFLQTKYTVTELPSYHTESASNPFETFQDIPRSSRYKFLLDDAEYFISGFIKGPVCRGQVALNVIRDRFWVVFIKPDLGVNLKFSKDYDHFLAQQDFSLPAADGDHIGLLKWRQFNQQAREYLQKKEVFANQIFAKHGGLKLNAIWDGDGNNQNAALTVFQHFDSATVVKGFVGNTPLTGWVVDYPILERIHYLLVAGFNVYGSVAHQLATRTYMDYLRMGAENTFLRFMPIKQRKTIYDSWYRGITGRMARFFNKPFYSSEYETRIHYQSSDYKKEFFEQIRTRFGQAAGARDTLNNCTQTPCIRPGITKIQQQVDQHIRKIAQLKGKELGLLPEISFLRVKSAAGQEDMVYTLLLNKALANVAIMFLENIRRIPDEDTLTVVPGFVGSYPNFFFQVDATELDVFTNALKSTESKKDIELFYATYGIRRTNTNIWSQMDWFNLQHKKQRGIHAGLFDMNRYHNL